MPPASTTSSGPWLTFSLLTVMSWGVYGFFLARGAHGMADPANGRLKAFLFVGLAYFLVAIIAPALLLILSGANFKYPVTGISWSFIAGVTGAIGAFFVLLAYGAGGKPPEVMSIVFAGAPVINALVAVWAEGLWSKTQWPFWVGILLAACGGALVTAYRPGPGAAQKPAPPAVTAPAAH